MKKYCQYNEEEILDEIIKKIGITNKFFVEIGCHANGAISNTFLLKENGWIGHWFDTQPAPGLIHIHFNAENVNEILKKYNVPQRFDFLSLDIDGNDYYVWKAMNFRPRIVCIEYNIKLKKGLQEYDPMWMRKYWDTFGASKKEMLKLAKNKKYTWYAENEANLFFISNETLYENK